MLILSQDKQTVINFDNVKTLNIVERTDKGATIVANYTDSKFDIVANYSSMEQGKKILNEIFSGYRGSAGYSLPADRR